MAKERLAEMLLAGEEDGNIGFWGVQWAIPEDQEAVRILLPKQGRNTRQQEESKSQECSLNLKQGRSMACTWSEWREVENTKESQ